VDSLGKNALIKVLAAVLYEVVEHKVSTDVAFKRACKGRCVKSLEEREGLYEMARKLVSDYIKIKCATGLRRPYSKVVRSWLRGVEENRLPEWCRLSYPKWFYFKLLNLLGSDEVRELLKAMNERVYWLRINTLKSSHEEVLKELDAEEVDYEVDRDIDYMVRVRRSPKPVRLLKPVKEFKAIIQDKASAAVVEALKPEKGDIIIDMSFAPGMKTSLIEMIAENGAKVVAVDVSYKRARMGYYLLRRLGVDVNKVWIISADTTDLFFRTKFNKVLLDAPCSNSGAISKDPGLKTTLTEGKINYYSSIQRRLLEKALLLGEEVVYSTCSLMPEEGELVIGPFMKDAKLMRAIPWASKGYEIVDFNEDVMRLFPHRHLTEGFFIAKLKSR
jgi:16S rRNA (cytosine967-C5)-methyltransferase